MKQAGFLVLGMVSVLGWLGGPFAASGQEAAKELVIVCPRDASPLEVLASREVCRYVYLRTLKLLPIVASGGLPQGGGGGFVVARKDRPIVAALAADAAVKTAVAALEPQQYLLRTLESSGRRFVLIAGGDDVGTLYGAYRLAECLGVQFYMHGDAVPDARVPLEVPRLDEQGKPLFSIRGIQPFHDFAEGPDWWNLDDYKAIISQLPKMRMNFIGLHTYPEGGVGPEPTVWIGQPGDVGEDGKVAFAYSSRWLNTMGSGGWGYEGKKTGDYTFGASQMFEHDAYGCDVMIGCCPRPTTPEASLEVFERAGALLRGAFTHAHLLGVKTCVGTETPLIVPGAVRGRLAEAAGGEKARWARPLGGKVTVSPAPVAGTDDSIVYQSVRWDLNGYQLTLPNGTYGVTLKFAEAAHDAPGKRVFGVKIQGQRVIDKLDIFAEAGRNKALDRTFKDVKVADGRLNIEFVRVVESPCIAGIVVEGDAFRGKLNCGGGACKDYLGDGGPLPLGPADIQKLYEGMFLRIARTYPIDYYWLWTPEGWTWGGAPDAEVQATIEDLKLAVAAAKKVNAPFTLATCGWVLGPPKDRAMFDTILPKDMPFSCINRDVGKAPVEVGFQNVRGRPKWAIPWMEDDPNLICPQLWAGRMRKDAADALKYGCTGLLGIHWRTRILGPNVSALAKAAWDQSAWSKPQPPPAEGPRKEGPVGGLPAAFPNNPITGTDDAPLYQTVRYDVSAYRLPLANGKYTVTLKFCEPHYKEAGKRVFSVTLQGKAVIDKLDIFAKVGQNKALDYAFNDVEVANGWLDIDFVHEVEFPSIAAICIEGPGGKKKVNCGGGAYKDYAADWPPSGPAPAQDRFAPVGDFYLEWATAHFGGEVAAQAARIFERIDGRLPMPSTWINGPGGIGPDGRPLEKIYEAYAFVDELEALRPQVKGGGNLERFDYWLSNFRYMKAIERVKNAWARFNQAMKEVNDLKDAAARADLAEKKALPLRRELVQACGEVSRHLLATVTTPGEMGTVSNWEQHTLPGLLTRPGEALAGVLGKPLPADAQPSATYSGPPRLIVPAARGSVQAGEALNLKVIVLADKPPQKLALYWRLMGRGDFAELPLDHVARGVYRVKLPAQAPDVTAVEYYVKAVLDGGETLHFPASAPAISQTVVVTPAPEG